MFSTAGEVMKNSWTTFFYGLLRMDTIELADQQKVTFINSARILDKSSGPTLSNDR